MATIKVKYYTIRYDKNGDIRARYWQPSKKLIKAGWKLVRLPNDETLAIKKAQELNAQVAQWVKNSNAELINIPKNTVDFLIGDYRRSHRYMHEISPKTRHGYDYHIKTISRLIGDKAVDSIRPSHISKIYETLRAKTPAQAAALVRVGRLIFEHGVKRDMITQNPWSKPGIRYKSKKGNLWQEEAVRVFVDKADAMGYFGIGTAVKINEWLGQRQGDIISLKMSAIKSHEIYICQNKTKAEIYFPLDLVPEIADRISEQISRNKSNKICATTLIQSPEGKSYTGDRFGKLFSKIRAECEKDYPGMGRLVFMDLRHTAITRMAEYNIDTKLIASISGHTYDHCETIIDRYNIRTKRMARQAIEQRVQGDKLRQLEIITETQTETERG